jgi:hypothetical protein
MTSCNTLKMLCAVLVSSLITFFPQISFGQGAYNQDDTYSTSPKRTKKVKKKKGISGLSNADDIFLGSPSIERLRVSDGNSIHGDNIFWVLLSKQDNKWAVGHIYGNVSDATAQLSKEKRGSEELLVFSPDLRLVEPFFARYVDWFKRTKPSRAERKPGDYSCTSGDNTIRPAYNPCDSSLTVASRPGSDAVVNVLGGIATLGMVHLAGGTTYGTSIDKNKVLVAVHESGVFPQLVSMREEYKIRIYREKFDAAKNSNDYKSFIALVERTGFDPDKRLEIARKALADFELKQYRQYFSNANSIGDCEQFIQQYSQYDPEHLVPKVKKRLDGLKKQQALDEKNSQARIHAENEKLKAQLNAWRKKLRVGEDTFCGPVIEVRHPMIKIAVSATLSGYNNEVWLKANQVYPPSMAGCRNVNGHISPAF